MPSRLTKVVVFTLVCTLLALTAGYSAGNRSGDNAQYGRTKNIGGKKKGATKNASWKAKKPSNRVVWV